MKNTFTRTALHCPYTDPQTEVGRRTAWQGRHGWVRKGHIFLSKTLRENLHGGREAQVLSEHLISLQSITIFKDFQAW